MQDGWERMEMADGGISNAGFRLRRFGAAVETARERAIEIAASRQQRPEVRLRGLAAGIRGRFDGSGCEPGDGYVGLPGSRRPAGERSRFGFSDTISDD
jgi:hypothetical protein